METKSVLRVSRKGAFNNCFFSRRGAKTLFFNYFGITQRRKDAKYFLRILSLRLGGLACHIALS